MNRDSGHRQIVIADGVHAHHREDAANVEQLLRCAEADGTVSFSPQPVDFAAPLESRTHPRIAAQRLGIDFGDELHEGPVLRNLRAIHVGHRMRKHVANVIRMSVARDHQNSSVADC